MRLLVVHPGASISTADVYNGVFKALVRAGYHVEQFRLDWRIDDAARWLNARWRARRKTEPACPKPGVADILFRAHLGVVEQVKINHLDAVLVISAMYTPVQLVRAWRASGIPVAVLGTEDPYDQEQFADVLEAATLGWTNERSSVPFLATRNPRVAYLPHAYDIEVHRADAPVKVGVRRHDVVFVGTGFPERVETLAAVDWDGIDLGLYGVWDVGRRHPLARHVRSREPIPNADAVALYAAAKIGLNLFRTSKGNGFGTGRIEHAESLNPRMLELAACGVFTISDYRAEVEEVFGRLVPTFRSPAELGDLCRHWLGRPEERRSVAGMLPAAVAGRTFDRMASRIVRDLADALAPPPSNNTLVWGHAR
jgi:hypothetical protein